jgi:hypothetical protein
MSKRELKKPEIKNNEWGRNTIQKHIEKNYLTREKYSKKWEQFKESQKWKNLLKIKWKCWKARNI